MAELRPLVAEVVDGETGRVHDGLVLFGIVVVLVAVTPASFERNAAVFLPLAVVASLAYLCLNLAYWFRAPTIGIFLSVLMFSSAWVLDFVVRK